MTIDEFCKSNEYIDAQERLQSTSFALRSFLAEKKWIISTPEDHESVELLDARYKEALVVVRKLHEQLMVDHSDEGQK
ncbi:MAG: hypothetical protein ACLQBJ_06645 [Bryobacteraceae bacterium]